MPVHAYMHSRLMEESEARVEMAACFDSPADTLVADRILRNPERLSTLGSGKHNRLMRAVSGQARLPRQVVALRSTAFGLIHRKATFEYLRDRQITGARRHRLIAQFLSESATTPTPWSRSTATTRAAARATCVRIISPSA